MAHFTVRNRCNLPRRAHQLVSAYRSSPPLTSDDLAPGPALEGVGFDPGSMKVSRQRVDLSDTGSFGQTELKLLVDLPGRTWVRLQVWDVACNGAFTQPVWLKPADSGNAELK